MREALLTGGHRPSWAWTPLPCWTLDIHWGHKRVLPSGRRTVEHWGHKRVLPSGHRTVEHWGHRQALPSGRRTVEHWDYRQAEHWGRSCRDRH